MVNRVECEIFFKKSPHSSYGKYYVYDRNGLIITYDCFMQYFMYNSRLGNRYTNKFKRLFKVGRQSTDIPVRREIYDTHGRVLKGS